MPLPHTRRSFDPLPRRPPSATEPVTVNVRTLPPDVVVPSHHHPWAQLAYPIRGAIRICAAGTAWIVPANRAVWIPPEIDHDVTVLGAVELRTLYISSAAAPLPLDACTVVDVSPLLRALCEAIAEGVGDTRHHLMMQLALEEMRIARPLSLGLPLPRDRRLKTLCDALMADPADGRGLAEWAEQVGASERTLARLFQSELDTSFGAWRQQLRLARAVDEISRGLPVAQVAATVGYASQAAFSAMFSRALGVPPSRFGGR
ncbi:helix-turn-helix transcriptional regulator [Zoogloea sp.]|jgi:AraC-like DNA-binding protein|uniref:AraC family transcriptional regulator n=1 Tax=Zoogloea sp. TaxID=49181 RepID=UPI0011D4ADE2|nr:helix-turn-helix transcriptional regulator [Zoogloea sp.]MBK6653910.1 helix-turn-helix transcriptional regulator [Zoogloea sp.]MBK7847344.1 helix-turn-helix transcriptional regulator [Zoogloea sp.]MBP7443871.1 helix-turn-helix transcriptional regulator [Zoogloea sp.]TXG87600.1 MAG: AraC family transcriptional regulator [Zoogloea sp.]HOY01629.1 helix-turn-helix transcriptional regulator [Zoogloea sp.]